MKTPGLKCVVCGTRNNRCIDTRGHSDGNTVHRRRVCENGHRFSTEEFVIIKSIKPMPEVSPFVALADWRLIIAEIMSDASNLSMVDSDTVRTSK